MNIALNLIAKTSSILMAAAILCFLLRRASAATRHAVWVLAITSALVLPFAAAVVPALQLPVWLQTRSTQLSRSAATATLIVGVGQASKPPAAYSTAGVFAVLWALGVGLLLVRLMAGLLGVWRLSKHAERSEDETWREILLEISNRLGYDNPSRLLFSSPAMSPMTWGIRRRSILLPSSAHDWPVERRRVVLAHELAHVKRNDGIVHLLIQLTCSIYWFNPLVWCAARRARIECECACDDYVLNLGGSAVDYADHLVQIVRGLQGRKALSFAALSMAQPSQLEARLVSILDARARRRAMSKTGMMFLGGLTAGITLLVAGVNITGAVPMPPVILVTTRTPLPPETKTIPTSEQRIHIGNSGTVTASTLVPPRVVGPAAALYADVEGTVTLQASVDVQGNITVLRVLKGLNPELDERAIAAAMTWRFSPALKDGIPVAAISQIEVDFTLPPETFRRGGNVTPPTVISRVEPQYTDAARNAHHQGTVILEAVIRKDGSVDIRRVVQSIGYGLDENAVAALKQWAFRPGMKNGQPVDVALNIEVNFHLRDDPPAKGSTGGTNGLQLKIDSPQ
jgi:TonB family protein